MYLNRMNRKISSVLDKEACFNVDNVLLSFKLEIINVDKCMCSHRVYILSLVIQTSENVFYRES